jgi:hypothetical protein
MILPPVLLRLLSPRGWAIFGAVALLGLVVVPVLHGAVPATSALHLPDHALALLILFIQKRPQGIFALKGRAAEAG